MQIELKIPDYLMVMVHPLFNKKCRNICHHIKTERSET
jgi:hypothetical protein